MNDQELINKEKEEDEIMDTVHASADAEVVAKPRNVKDMKKANAKKLTPEEERKEIERNVMGEFYD